MFRTPDFWYRPAGASASWQSYVLRPFSWLYGLGRALHCLVKVPRSIDIPVLCLGNLNAGGAGKTPAAMAVMDLIGSGTIARKPGFLLRGYGGSLQGPLQVNPAIHNSTHVGEEALLLAACGDTYIATDRYAGGRYAAAQGVDVLIMDDGLQNRALQSDVKLVVVNGAMGFGNGQLIPAGPLREPLHPGLEMAHGVILIGEDTHDLVSLVPEGKPVFQTHMTTAPEDMPPKDIAYLAFAGIGYPQKFFNYARDDLGLNVKECVSFADHHIYSDADLGNLVQHATSQGLSLLTTDKDIEKLRDLPGFAAASVTALPMRLRFDDARRFQVFLQEALS